MSTIAEEFLVKSDEKAFDMPHRKTINHNIGKYNIAVERGLSKFVNLEASKKKAHVIKWRVMENLDKFLPEFESNFQKRGGKVIWANDVEEAQKEILNIIKKRGGKTVIKSNLKTLYRNADIRYGGMVAPNKITVVWRVEVSHFNIYQNRNRMKKICKYLR